jgi:integrase
MANLEFALQREALDKSVLPITPLQGKLDFVILHIPPDTISTILRYSSTLRENRFMFFNEATGRHLQDIKTAFRTAKKKAGIKGRLRDHDLRHPAASWMIEDGIDLVTVKEILGHASVQTTMIYCHPRKEIKHRAAALLGERIRPETVDVLVDTKGERRPEKVSVTSSPPYS